MSKALPLPDHELAALPDDGGPDWNRLVFASSPYLLQHAANPVKWWPWGDEAFQEAARLDRPVLLSIGYATCHWCHVMAHESFEDAEVAALLNEHFICIKVDREERPDVDHTYMEACMALSGQGGWPLTAFLLPDRRVFHAGTYFPKEPSQGRHGMMSLIPALASFWKDRRAELETAAKTLRDELVKYQLPGDVPEVTTRDRVETALHQFSSRFDKLHGGFGSAPKFPVPHQFLFLIKAGRWLDDPQGVEMARESLLAICRGGIRDHVGGGFHRYSTDASWLVPHFEKMLYDQALLVMALAEAHAESPDARFEDAVREAVAYVERDLALAGGGYACGEDADSEGVEGLFYFWTRTELIQALGKERGERAGTVFQTRADGNFIPEHGPASAANILHLPTPWPEDEGRDLRADLLVARSRRIRPSRDEKILTDWNGLWCAALARAGQVFGQPEWIQKAEANARFIGEQLFAPGRRLHRLFRDRAGIDAGLDDFAAQIWARLELHQATGDESHLSEALALEDEASNLFWEESRGAYFMSAAHQKDLPLRPLAFHDGALPSGNGLMALNLARLWRLTGIPGLESRARLASNAPGASLARSPVNHAMSLLALYTLDGASQDVVHAGSVPPWFQGCLAHSYHPNRLIRPRGVDASPPSPWMSAMEIPQSGFRVWVCADRVCRLPVEDPADLEIALDI